MNLSEIRRVASSLQRALFNRGNSFALGMWKSHFKGNGLQFKEHQVYSYGDEVRFIDWKLTARTSHPYIKTFEEERNLIINIVIDATSSMYEGHYEKSKLQGAIEIAGLIIILAGKTRDSVNVTLIHEDLKELRNISGDMGLVKFIKFLQKENILDESSNFIRLKKLSKQPEMDEVENFVAKKSGKSRELVILSDYENYFYKDHFYSKFLRTNFHLFRMCSNSSRHEKKSLIMEVAILKENSVHVGEIHDAKNIKINKKIQDIDISKNHLELFIGHMS